MKGLSVLRGVVLGVCVIAGCAISFIAGTRAGSALQRSARSASIVPTVPPPVVVARGH